MDGRRTNWRFLGVAVASALFWTVLLAWFLWMTGLAFAHEAPTGWSSPYACCSDIDCRPIPQNAVAERPEGYVIKATGEVIPYSDRRVKDSPDGDMHWCSVAGAEDSRTICLFVPPRAF